MRPLNEMLSAPLTSLARVSVPPGRLRVQRFAWARASFALGARQARPLHSPGVEREIVICSFATAESVK